MNRFCLYFVMLLLFSCGLPDENKATLSYESRLIVNDLMVDKTMMNCNCHTQGVAWCSKTNQMVITCQGADGFSYIALFPDYADGHNKKAIEVIKNDASERSFSHPSALQIYDGLTPVAITNGRRDSTFIYFYNLKNQQIIDAELPILTHPKHIGALGFNQINDKLVLIGFGWDANYFAIWESDLDPYDFKLIQEGTLSEITDSDTGAYNSIWIGKQSGKDILIASCGSFYSSKKNYLDIYNINPENGKLFLQKKSRVYVNDKPIGTMKSLFFEGVSVRNVIGDSLQIIATPQDFRKTNDGAILNYLYEGMLIPMS